MKKLSLLVLSLFAAISAFAQPTLTATDLNPVAGDKFYGQVCDPTGISNGASGPAVTWNLAGLTAMFMDTTIYVPCFGTYYCDSFPGSTLASSLGGGDYEYFITNTAGLAYSGVGQSSGSTYFRDFYTVISCPMTYTTAVVDSYFASNPVNATYNYGVDTFTGDGYGTLVLPSGTYTNVLRVHVVSIDIDSDLSGGSPVVDTTRSEMYNWYIAGFHNPLLTMQYDSSGGVWSLSNVEYYTKPAITTGITQLNTAGGIEIYPNPASSTVSIHLTTRNGGPVSISATDIMGRSVGETLTANSTDGANEIHYSVASLPNGVYMLHIQSEGNSIIKKLQVIR
jgi:type IX secretion system substrate protein